MSRGSLHTWRKQNPRFQRATRNAREDHRGLVTDGLEDLQVATAQFLDACIRSDNLSVRDRLPACNIFLRHLQSGAFVPVPIPTAEGAPSSTANNNTASSDERSDLANSSPDPRPRIPDPAACIAMTYLTRDDTEETRFHERIAAKRKDHEAALDRLEAKLCTLQTRREARE